MTDTVDCNGCYITDCNETIVYRENTVEYLNKNGAYYDLSSAQQTQKAVDRFMESILSDAYLGFRVGSESEVDLEILSYQLISSIKQFSIQLYILNNQMRKTDQFEIKFSNVYNIWNIFSILKTNPLCIKFMLKHSEIWKQLLYFLVYALKFADCSLETRCDKPHKISNICWKILGYTSFYWKRRHFKFCMKHTFHWLWHSTLFRYWTHHKDSTYFLWKHSSKLQFEEQLKQSFKMHYEYYETGKIDFRPDGHFIAMKHQLKWPMVFPKFESKTTTIMKNYISLDDLRKGSLDFCNAAHVDFCDKHKSKDRKKCYMECITIINSLFFATTNQEDIAKFNNLKYCSFCRKNKKNKQIKFKHNKNDILMICKGCKLTYYCSRRCQKLDWKLFNHKRFCLRL